ncbi:four helix bundle protein [Clostridium weizhouense]|uniref:Four helix bundle protein n=1 Tax=Clostridium weizhouense TaxID=2859781 RepID=A0ABS7ANL1_9CLOT|nr:four helix bundle protein [Clostridium weizhouense]MBW6410256.1 four helix bundle protein [Clostridium weizhouense]
MKENIIVDKCFSFALKIIEIYRYLVNNKKEFVLSKQLLRSGTSIGANVKESINAISKADFRNKISIALKEADETEHWLELMLLSDILCKNEMKSLLQDCKEICRILNSIVRNSSN